MRLIILTQYFPPEIGAPQNRLFELALRLQKLGVEISVLTAMPNYPQMRVHDGYRNKRYIHENIEGIDVHRAWIYVPKSKSIVKRLLNYFSFVYTSFWTGWRRLKKADFLLVESPPLFLGMTAVRLARLKKAKMIFNVSDLWPESAEKLNLVNNKFFLKMSYRLEARLYRKSAFVTGQTQGIVKSIHDRFPNKTVYWLRNGVDLSFFNPDNYSSEWRTQSGFADDDQLFLYAGILGYAQGLEVIIHAAEILQTHQKLKFVFVGSGPEKERLGQLVAEKKLNNIFFFDAVSKSKMPEIVSACDASIIPLKKLDLFKGAIPSKVFETMAMRKPILLGVEGEAKELFIDEGKAGLAFEPENAQSLAESIQQLVNNPSLFEEYGRNGHAYVSEKFNRDIIALEFHDFLKNQLS